MISRLDLQLMSRAKDVATLSKDPEVKVGCVLVSGIYASLAYQEIVTGYNDIPINLLAHFTIAFENKYLKNMLIVHAELNAILNARSSVEGWVLYTTNAPCVNCALAIIQAGIVRVVRPPINIDSSWANNQQFASTLFEQTKVMEDIL